MLFCPQHLTPPAFVSAQVWLSPAAIARTPLVSPLTSTGVRRCVVELSPSWPLPLSPQHFTPPAIVSAHVCVAPVAIATTPRREPDHIDRRSAAA